MTALPNPLAAIEGQITAKVLAHQPLILKQMESLMNPAALEAKMASHLSDIENRISTAIAAKIDKCLAELLGNINIDTLIFNQINAMIDELMSSTWGC